MSRYDRIRAQIDKLKSAVLSEFEKQTSAREVRDRGELPLWQYDKLKRDSDAEIVDLRARIAALEHELGELDATMETTPDDAIAAAPDDAKPSIFISYQRDSEAEATALNVRLMAHGYDVWQDVSNIRHTDKWAMAINQALDTCDRIIVLLTPESMNSTEVFNEWFYFYDERKPIHCLMLKTCRPHYQLRPFQWLDWRDPAKRDWERLFRELDGAFTYLLPDTVIVSDSAPERSMDEMFEALRATVTRADGSVALTQKQIDEIVLKRPQTDDEQRLQQIAEWSKPRYALDNKFVRLTLQIDKGHDAGDPQRETPVSKTFTDLRQVLAERPDDTALILLGEPGAGKSTLLRRLQLDDAIDRLRDGGRRLSFFISLNNYRPEKEGDPLPSPREWLNAMWSREYPSLETFDSLLWQGRMLLLLDALNEMPHNSDDEYRRRIEMWQVFLVSIRSDHHANRAIITCRTRDYAVLIGTKELPVPRVDIQRMTDQQVQEFLDVYIPDKASDIWKHLEGTPQLELFRTPYYLNLLTLQVERFGTIPAGRAALFTGFVRETLFREIEGKNPLFNPNGLLDGDDCHQIQHSEWRDGYELPEGGSLIPGLTRFAYHAQERGRVSDGAQVRLRESDARALINHDHSARIIKAGVDLTVLDKLGRDVQFFHQLLQEFFAARQLAADPNPDLIRREWQAGRVSPGLAETMALLESSDPLPPLPTTGWEQTTLLATAMATDPDAFVRGLIEADLPTAARCAAQPDAKVSEALKNDLRRRLMARTQDMTADLRHRIDAGLALGEIGDPRFERRNGSHGEYLLPPMIPIPAGEYLIGDDNRGYDDERPAHTVPLDAFEIGQFPVTNAEFALFMKAGGYEDERWWDTEAAKAWLRGEGSSEGAKQQWRDNKKGFEEWTEEYIRSLASQNRITAQQADDWIVIRNWTDELFEQQLEEWYPSGQKYREPEFWNDVRFNAPSQPVVGVTWFEARAYCAWFSEQTGQMYRLPAEVEREAAARGLAGRQFPYDGGFDPAKNNTFESHIRRTTPVGIYQAGMTPEGAHDLSGNVLDWTSTLYEGFNYRYEPADGREDPETNGRRVVRGGSWISIRQDARAAFRNGHGPYLRISHFGFRLVRPPSL